MSRESLLDSFTIVRASLTQHGRRTNDDSGYAEAALHSTFEHEGFAQHISHFFRNAFERHDIAAFHLFRVPQTGQHGPPVYQHRAAAAGAFRGAAILGRDDAALLAQDFQEVHSRLVRDLNWLSV